MLTQVDSEPIPGDISMPHAVLANQPKTLLDLSSHTFRPLKTVEPAVTAGSDQNSSFWHAAGLFIREHGAELIKISAALVTSILIDSAVGIGPLLSLLAVPVSVNLIIKK